jgi:hypothetical protein
LSGGREDHLADLDLVEDHLDQLGLGRERLLGREQAVVGLERLLDRGARRGGIQVPGAQIIVEEVGDATLETVEAG